VWFEGGNTVALGGRLALDRRTRMVYDPHHVFINGESFLASGRDAQLMHLLADQRYLGAADVKRLSSAARTLLADWCEAGWLYADQ
jgi:50S ribosomal protein L16 3-hydroxylase